MKNAYAIQQKTASAAFERILAINNPAASLSRLVITCVQNTLILNGTTADFRLERFPSLATGGTAASFEPGDDDADLPRVCRRDSTSPEPAFIALGGAFTAPTGRESDESFAIRSRDQSMGDRDLSCSPLIVNPGECAILTLLGSEASEGARVTVELVEESLIPPIAVGSGAIVRLEGELFSGTAALSSTRWTTGAAGTGTATVVDGELVVSTGATADSTIAVETVRHARFLSDEPHEFDAWVRIADAGATGNVRRWGAFTSSDGFFFELSGTSTRVVSRKAGVDSVVASTAWDRRGFALDTNYHHYDVRYNGGDVEFYIDRVLVHRLLGLVATPRTKELDLPIAFESLNSGGLASDRQLLVRNTSIKRYGPQSGAGHHLHMAAGVATTTAKSGAGTLKTVLVNGAGTGGSTVTLYDNTAASGVTIAILNSDAQGAFPYDLEFSTGLTIAKTTNSPDITVVFD